MSKASPKPALPSAAKRKWWCVVLILLGFLAGGSWMYWQSKIYHAAPSATAKPSAVPLSSVASEPLPTVDSQTFFIEQINFMTDQLRLALQWQPDSALAPAIAGRMQVVCLRHGKLPLASNVLVHVQKLQTDLALLPTMDMVSLRNQLADLQTRIGALDPKLRPVGLNENKPVASSGFWWQSFWQHMQQLIVIRYHKEKPEPLLSADQSLYLKLNLQLLITQTGVAIAGHDWALAAQDLQTVRQQLQSYYDVSEANGKQSIALSGVMEARVQQMQQPQAMNLIMQDLDAITATLQTPPSATQATG